MEQKAWAYILGEADGRFCVGAHQGRDLERHVVKAHGRGRASSILWAERFNDEQTAQSFVRRFQRLPYRRKAALVIGDQCAA